MRIQDEIHELYKQNELQDKKIDELQTIVRNIIKALEVEIIGDVDLEGYTETAVG